MDSDDCADGVSVVSGGWCWGSGLVIGCDGGVEGRGCWGWWSCGVVPVESMVDGVGCVVGSSVCGVSS